MEALSATVIAKVGRRQSQDPNRPVSTSFTSSATVAAKVGGRRISRPSAARFRFHIINHCHGVSGQALNLRTLSG